MIPPILSRRAQELTARCEPFVTATVVRVQHPTSVEPGNVALVRGDGTIEGFVGGVCAQHSVRLYALQSIESGEPLLLRIMPDPEVEDPDEAAIDAGHEIAREDGAVTVRNPCLSGGAIEIFLEPALPAPRMLVAGDSPIVGSLLRLGPELGLEVVSLLDRAGDAPAPSAADLALVVAAHGRDEVSVLRAGLQAGVPYVGLVASEKRGRAVLAELREDGISDELIGQVDTPAGIAIGARTPAEIALSILARIVSVRRSENAPATARGRLEVTAAPAAPPTAVDPICGMTVVVVADTPSTERDGETMYFCCEGCKHTFEQQRAA